MPVDFTSLSLPYLFAAFALAGAFVWFAGTRLTGLVDQLSDKTGLGRGAAGMLLLGGITSLPEVATVSTASATGNPELAVNNLLGSASINVLLLAIGDMMFRRGALTSMSAKPSTLMQGVLGMLVMTGVAIAVAIGDYAIAPLGIGLGAAILALACFQSQRIAARFEGAHVWEVVNPPDIDRKQEQRKDRDKGQLILLIVIAALVILVAGAALSMTGDAIAQKTGLGSSIVGFVLVGLGTSLPELSSIFAALKLRQYELAIGDIFGTNLFNIQLIFLADIIHRDGPVLAQAGTFEIVGAGMAILMTGIFVIGLIERRNRTIFRVGEDSALALVTFCGGLFILAQFA